MSLYEVAGTTPTKRTRNRSLDLFRSKVRAMSLLEENLVSAGERTFTFRPGWSDNRVAQEVGAPLHVIRHMRLNLFGSVTRGRPAGSRSHASLNSRIEALTKQVEALTEDLARIKRALGE